MKGTSALGNKERALIALSAAMGAGCRTCARRLHPMAKAAGAGDAEVDRALRVGVEMRQYATTTVRREVDALLGRELLEEEGAHGPEERRLEELSRLAAAVGANSSPDARRHLEAALAAGATEAGVSLAIELAGKVRSKAAQFSDEEIAACRREQGVSGRQGAGEAPASCCGGG